MKKLSVLLLIFVSYISQASDKCPIKGWELFSSKPGIYNAGIENIDGKTAACLVSEKVVKSAWGCINMKAFKADKYCGKRMRFSADVKTKDATGGVMLRFIEVSDSSGFYKYNFDNMRQRPIKGTTDWKNYNLVIDIPKGSISIVIAMDMDSTGKAWIANLKLEEVDTTIALTGKTSRENKWIVLGKNPADYETTRDSTMKWHGVPAYHCTAKSPNAKNDINIAQYFSASSYIGKKVRVTAWIKTSGIRSFEYFVVTISYSDGKTYGKYSHYISKKLQQTKDWTKYEIVVYIPENSLGLEYFLDVSNRGEVWINDPTVEIVDNNTPTTDKKEKKYPAKQYFADGPILTFTPNN